MPEGRIRRHRFLASGPITLPDDQIARRHPCPRIELWRPRPAPFDVRLEYRVLQLDAAGRMPEQQPAAAHVAAADEGRWEVERPAKGLNKYVDVLSRGHAAEKHDTGAGGKLCREHAQIALQRLAIPHVVGCDIDAGELADEIRGHDALGGLQAARRRDDKRGIGRKPARVGDLAAKVETAAEAERLTERQRTRAQSPGDRECRVRPEQYLRAA